jgi:RIO-like serine/threonine protein kinase
MRIVARRNPKAEAAEARAQLAAEDWRIVRAMEAYLAERDAIPAELHAKRQELREKAGR